MKTTRNETGYLYSQSESDIIYLHTHINRTITPVHDSELDGCLLGFYILETSKVIS